MEREEREDSNLSSSCVGSEFSEEHRSVPYPNEPPPFRQGHQGSGLGLPLSMDFCDRDPVYFQHCLVGFLLDFRRFSTRLMQNLVNGAWNMRGRRVVESRTGNRYLFWFQFLEDRQIILDNSPWALEGALLIMETWVPFTSIGEMQTNRFMVWVQPWGLPLECHTNAAA